ncbi:hypothetical protein WMY93_005520 [Mugilogobius chulae]|uniref:Clarin 2 n=1 Tax=Mugilogobius chulae TaxID=88201 RepID=A0AAW0PI43_9GOBI
MPSVWKQITFSAASVLCVGSVVLLVVAMSTERWITGQILCKTGAEIVNASNPEMDKFMGHIYFGLFQGGKTKNCGLGNRRSKIYIFPKLVRTLNSGLHIMVFLFLLASMGFAVVSLSFSIYNARKVPYQSIKGHKGLYLWNVIAALLGSFGVLCFIAAMSTTI